MKQQKQFEATLQLLATLDSNELPSALIDSIRYYTESLNKGNLVVSDSDSNNIYVMLSLLRALLKDLCGLSL